MAAKSVWPRWLSGSWLPNGLRRSQAHGAGGIEAFRAFLRSIGMPLTFAEIGADPADIPELVEMNRIGDGKTGGYIGLDRQAHFDIYNLAAGNCVPEN